MTARQRQGVVALVVAKNRCFHGCTQITSNTLCPIGSSKYKYSSLLRVHKSTRNKQTPLNSRATSEPRVDGISVTNSPWAWGGLVEGLILHLTKLKVILWAKSGKKKDDEDNLCLNLCHGGGGRPPPY